MARPGTQSRRGECCLNHKTKHQPLMYSIYDSITVHDTRKCNTCYVAFYALPSHCHCPHAAPIATISSHLLPRSTNSSQSGDETKIPKCLDTAVAAVTDVRRHPIMFRISAMSGAVFLSSPPRCAPATAATSIPALSSFQSFHVSQ